MSSSHGTVGCRGEAFVLSPGNPCPVARIVLREHNRPKELARTCPVLSTYLPGQADFQKALLKPGINLLLMWR